MIGALAKETSHLRIKYELSYRLNEVLIWVHTNLTFVFAFIGCVGAVFNIKYLQLYPSS